LGGIEANMFFGEKSVEELKKVLEISKVKQPHKIM